MRQKKFPVVMAVATCLLLLLVLAALCIGRYSISAAEVLRYLFLGIEENSMIKTVMWSVRIPRILMALLVGAGLSVSGVSLQAMFGNPLVNAHILGVVMNGYNAKKTGRKDGYSYAYSYGYYDNRDTGDK